MDRSKFSAAASLTGYLYQCRIALLETLKRLKNNPSLTIAIETLDDVVFETEGNSKEIIQVKHHINRKANLTDASSDLWKTFRIWCDLYFEEILQNDTTFYMMTTAKAPEGSAAYYLKAEDRNIVNAERLLLQTAQTSVNKENEDAYLKFLTLSSESRCELLESVFILDQCPLNQDIDHHLKKEVWGACHRSNIDQFLIYLEGWWFKRILKSLEIEQSGYILGEEMDSYFDELREQFKSDALPIHDELKTATVDQEFYQNYTFVHQLKLIEIGAKRIAIAVNNFYRAFEQRSRWIREDLILVGDIEDYEKLLVEEWEIHFETMCENLGEDVAEREKIRAAKTIFDWFEKDASIPIRPRCNEPFITRGSYHILSDRQEVGWHPEFRTRLKHLLEVKVVST
ncbi:MAG: hypothetical protein C5S44_11945 [Candidatus Methanocomedens sp.]|nr:MAG: hypothetical protein C5S44_11945 [ANME-2 cluster archaeon]